MLSAELDSPRRARATRWSAVMVLAASVLAGMGFRAATVTAAASSGGVVSASGTQLTVDGQPFRFVGFNDFRLPSLSYQRYTCGGAHSDAEVDAELARMHDVSGATVVRTWFFQSYVAGTDMEAFDRVLRLADRHGIKVIPVLTNQWGTCENYRETADEYKTLAWYQGGYRTTPNNGMPLTYRDYALGLARRYASDPRIAMWQLVNEAEAADGGSAWSCQEGAATAALRSFSDDMAAALHAIDPTHLVSLGTLGGSHCGTNWHDYQTVHAGRIDVCEIHDYSGAADLGARNNPCAALGKPFFIGERGFAADMGTGAVSGGTLQQRAQAFDGDMASVFGSDVAGYLVWDRSTTASAGYDVGPGDPVEQVMARRAAAMRASPPPVPAPGVSIPPPSLPGGPPPSAVAQPAVGTGVPPVSGDDPAAILPGRPGTPTAGDQPGRAGTGAPAQAQGATLVSAAEAAASAVVAGAAATAASEQVADQVQDDRASLRLAGVVIWRGVLRLI